MSSSFGDDLPPRRAKPKPKPAIPDGGSTFRPADGPPDIPRPGKPRPKRSAVAAKGADDAIPEAGGPTLLERVFFGRVGTAHLAKFCRQFAAYQDAGVDLTKSLASLERQFARTALGPVIARLRDGVRRGEALGDAMAREPAAFDHLCLSMVRVAEARGGLPETMWLMADHYEARLSLMRQARSAMIYPIAVLLIAGAVIALLTVFVIPAMVKALDMDRGDLPGPTRLLVGISHFMSTYGWWAVPLILVGGGIALARAYRTGPGKMALDEISWYVPVLGLLRRKIDTARLARTLSTLLEAGVDLGSSLDLTADVLSLAPLKKVIRNSRLEVVEGTELSVAFDASGRFAPDVIAILESGEETGKIPESLAKLADDYEEQVAIMVRSLGALIQPILILVLGGIVFFIVLAFIMAYVAMLQNAMRI